MRRLVRWVAFLAILFIFRYEIKDLLIAPMANIISLGVSKLNEAGEFFVRQFIEFVYSFRRL